MGASFPMGLWFQDLGDIDPDLLQGLQKMIDYDGDDVEDIFAVDFTVSRGFGVSRESACKFMNPFHEVSFPGEMIATG